MKNSATTLTYIQRIKQNIPVDPHNDSVSNPAKGNPQEIMALDASYHSVCVCSSLNINKRLSNVAQGRTGFFVAVSLSHSPILFVSS